MKKIGLYGYFYDFSVDYDAIRHSQVFNEKSWYKIMFQFILKTFIVVTVFIGLSVANLLKCISMSNKQCKVRPVIMNINSNEPSFCPYSILVNNCSGSCNNINDPYAKLCVPDVIKT